MMALRIWVPNVPVQYLRSNPQIPCNYTLHLEVDEDTYWGLIKLGAEIKTDCETYAENILLGHVESEFDRKTQD